MILPQCAYAEIWAAQGWEGGGGGQGCGSQRWSSGWDNFITTGNWGGSGGFSQQRALLGFEDKTLMLQVARARLVLAAGSGNRNNADRGSFACMPLG